MIEKVTCKQPNSKKCFVCGLKNEFGLKASFYEMGNGTIVGVFKPEHNHQGYPGRLHGGLASAMLDETIGRAIMIEDKNIWGVTVELTVRYKKPIPIEDEVKVFARITNNGGRLFEGEGEIKLPNGEIAVSAKGKYMKLPLDKITDASELVNNWVIADSEKDPREIEIL